MEISASMDDEEDQVIAKWLGMFTPYEPYEEIQTAILIQ